MPYNKIHVIVYYVIIHPISNWAKDNSGINMVTARAQKANPASGPEHRNQT